MTSPEEKKDRRVAALVSLGVNSALLLLFFFLLAWQEPDPPLPEYGIELNFGLDETGAGETARPEPTPVVEKEPLEEVTEEVEEIEEILETPPELEEVQEPTEQVEYEAPVEESPDVVEEVPETVPEVVEELEEPVQEPEPGSLYPSSNTNQGASDQPVGDQGKEEGKVDERALYGAKGPSDGASLQMAGWNWDYIPRPQDNSNDNGRIVFQITIDDRGEIISIRTLEKTVSPAVERVYREAVEELTFSRTGDNVRAAATSTGKISFVIRSK
jgi:outer membrane biosynthesis protein TonB